MGGGAFNLVEQAEDVSSRELPKAVGKRTAIPPPTLLGGGQCLEQAVERPVLAEEEQLLFAAKVVVQVPEREIGGDRDITHAGVSEATGAEDLRGGAHDGDAAGVGAFRTAGWKTKHRFDLLRTDP